MYDVTLSGKSEKTLFASHYKDETLLQYVDNMNVVYVALTRAKECMEIISALPEEGDKDFSQLLHWYACKHGEELGFRREGDNFFYGEIPQKSDKKKDEDADSLTADFSSWPIGNRLRFKADSADFFNEDGDTGMAASQRIKGIVLHDILAHVNVKSDIDPAVEDAVLAGVISADEAGAVKELLYDRIDSVEAEGWFSDENESVFNEIEFIGSNGKVYRADRVMKVGNTVRIIDYKFGEHDDDYEKKLIEYADAWKSMGYNVDSACLWYVARGEIVRVL